MNQSRVVGIGFDAENDTAPRVMLKAVGEDAQSLITAARREDVPTVRDPMLIDQLYRVPMNHPIGRELFPVMAVLLAHVLRLDKSSTETASTSL